MFFIKEPHSLTEPCENGIEVVRKPIEPLVIVVVPIVPNGMIKGFDCDPVLVVHADHGDNICLGTGGEDVLDFLEIVLVNIIVVVHEAAVLAFGLLKKFLSFASNGLFAVINVREKFDTQRMFTGVHLGKEGSQGISTVVHGTNKNRQVVVIDFAVEVETLVFLPVSIVLAVQLIVLGVLRIGRVLMPYYRERKIRLLSQAIGLVHELVVAEERLVGGLINKPEPLVVSPTHTHQRIQLVSRIPIVEPQDAIGVGILLCHLVSNDLVVPLDTRDHVVGSKKQNVPVFCVFHVSVDGVDLALRIPVRAVVLYILANLVVVLLELVRVGRGIVVVEREEELGVLVILTLADVLEQGILELLGAATGRKLNQ
jgi:hypothetical protein